ncbi:MAG: ribose-5-phosphate isomerase RpiA [Caldilineaceae bacterium]
MSDRTNEQKQRAAEHAATFVESGMVVGLGTGSTAIHMVRRLGSLLNAGHLRDVVCVATSSQTEAEARKLHIPMTTLEAHPVVDLTIDGADEIDPQLNAIKGGGGALLREKIVAQASRRVIIVVDESKPSPILGTQWALPVEVIPFGWGTQQAFLKDLGANVSLRSGSDGQPFQTDQGNLILDCGFGPIDQLDQLNELLNRRVGIVEHGLFLGLITDLIVAGGEGIRHITR